MKKKIKMLLGLSALTLLGSCGAREITDSAEIADLKFAIVEKKAEIKNYWMTATNKETTVDKLTKEEKVSNDEMFLRMNEDGEEQIYVTYQSGEVSNSFYLVNDESYEKLIYCDSDSWFKGETTVIDRRTHKNEFDQMISEAFDSYNSVVDVFLNPNQSASLLQRFHTESDPIFQTKIKYFSSNKGQLTIKIDEVSAAIGDDTTNHFELNYEDFVFKGAKFTHSYSTEEYTKSFEFNVDFKVMNKVTITLPSGWENHLISDN